ncbi:hypothetical protein NEIRO03_0598 [Nematocida sp. AWRm78]|nr:hypothetical protein NEIRO02_0537 [Nematocida sp. AWRm79]KAI5182963.1 hypothetical protein NEIRO03_0598 [Nematocida sp. AWRm78]
MLRISLYSETWRHTQEKRPKYWGLHMIMYILAVISTMSLYAQASNVFSLKDYSWQVCTQESEFIIISFMDKTVLEYSLNNAICIRVTTRSERLNTLPPEGIELDEFLARWLPRINEVIIRRPELITNQLITILASIAPLETVCIVINKKENYTITACLSNLSKCYGLKTLILDMNYVTLSQDITLTLPKAKTFFFKNYSFNMNLSLLDMASAEEITIISERVNNLRIDYSSIKLVPCTLHLVIHTNYMGSIPLVVICNPNIYLEVIYLSKTPFSAQNNTMINSSNGILPGYSAYINKVLSYLVIQKEQVVFCCYKKAFKKWSILLKHISTHIYNNVTIITYNALNQKNTLSLPGRNQCVSEMCILTPEEEEQIAEFLQLVTIINLEIFVNGVYIRLLKESFPKEKSDWINLLRIIRTLSFSDLQGKHEMPFCFYKLYRLRALSVYNSQIPNLLEVLVSMPGLRVILVENCIFNHANTYVHHQYIQYSTLLDRSKTIRMSNNNSMLEERGKNIGAMVMCFTILSIFIILSILSIFYQHTRRLTI